MTIDEKVEAYRMYLEGASCDEIGKHLGVSRQCIRQHLPEPKISRIEMSANSCVYKGVSKWMLENKISCSKLARYSGVSVACLYRFLTGKGTANKTTIDKLLNVTKMSYEEAFSAK
mgnify:FL=1